MIEVMYISSNGKKFNLIGDKMRATNGRFHKYSWKENVEKRECGDDLIEFIKEANTYSLTLSLRGVLSERMILLDNLRDAFENDIIKKRPGRIYFGGWYIECFIKESDTAVSGIKNNWSSDDIKIYCPKSFWIREETIIYERKSRPETGFLDYPYDYRYDYTPNLNSVFLENTEVAPCDIKMVIQGPCLNPEVRTGDNKYQIMTKLSSYEYIVLNTSERTVYKVSYNGAISNVWGSLNRDYDNFKKVPGGKHIVTTNGNFKVQITAYLSRSEPRWI